MQQPYGARAHGLTLWLAFLVVAAGMVAPRSAAAGRTVIGRDRVVFESNQGQTDARVKFLARSGAYTLFLTSAEAVLALQGAERAVVRMKLLGAQESAPIVGIDELSSTANYFTVAGSTNGITGIPTFAGVKYVGIYPGIDLVYYGREGRIEYDFVLTPGADPDTIAFAFDGADALDVDTNGDLIVRTRAGDVRQLRPVIYQDVAGERREVAGRYLLDENRHVRLRVGAYDPSRVLVIDPVLVYGNRFGGNGDDVGYRIAVDSAGNAYVTGSTMSADFPSTVGRALRGNKDAFVTKVSPSGALIYSTYVGGPCDDEGRGIAVDAAGNAYITGRMDGLCVNPPQPRGVLVAKLNPTGAPSYVFTFGATFADSSVGQAIAVDTGGNAYVAGIALSSSPDFPTTSGALRTSACNTGVADGFVAKVNPAGTGLVYSTYLCGTAHESLNALAIDAAGNAYVAGSTESQDFPTVNAFQPTNNTGPVGLTGFVAKLNATGSALVYSTYLGGSFEDRALGITVDTQGNAYVTGDSKGGDFPTTSGVVQPTAPFPICSAGSLCRDPFVAKLSPTGSLIYSTYLAGERDDSGVGIAVDGSGNAYVAGSTSSDDFPIKDAFESVNPGAQQVFVAKLNADATRIVYSSYLGDGNAGGIAVDSQGNAYVSGDTPGVGTCGAFEACRDAFVAKITAGGPGVTPATHVEVTPTEVRQGGTITATWGGIPFPMRDRSRDRLVLYALGERADNGDNDPTTQDPKIVPFATNGADAGTLALTLPGTLPTGTYELRLLIQDPDSSALRVVIARSEPIYVSTGVTFTVTPMSAAPGATLNVTWSGIVNPTPTDWIALYSRGTVDVTYLDWMYVSCSKTPSTSRVDGSCGFVLPAGLAPGTYELRLFANNSFARLGTSGAITVGAAGASLGVSPTSTAPGGSVTATWSGIANPTAADWIGLFAQGAADSAYLDWVYVSCSKTPSTARAAGSCAVVLLTNLAPGMYELRLFANGGSTRLATSNALTVSAAGPSLGASPMSAAPGGTVTASWSGIANPTAGDWIGLFAQGTADTAFIDWLYVSCSKTANIPRASGSCAVVVPTNLASGTYELRLFANNSFTRLATSSAITVGAAGPSLGVSPTSASPGGTVTANWSGIANPTAGDWIGLFAQGAADTAFIDWIYVSCSKTPSTARASGSCALPLPTNLASGAYELRLFANNGFTRLATSNITTVGVGGPSLSVSPTSSAPGSTVTVSWSGIANPTAGDWVGLFAQGAADTAIVDWMYVSCSKTPNMARATGSCALILPAGLASGTYELRLFANNGFTRLATSSALTVR